MTPRWFRVANGYPNKRGPTIPFLLGALRKPPGRLSDEGTCQAELRELLVAMRDETPDGYHTAITSCGVIGQLIVTVSFARPATGATWIASPSNAERGLYIEPIYGLPDPDLDSLAKELWRRYGDTILAGQFSYLEEIGKCLTSDEREEA